MSWSIRLPKRKIEILEGIALTLIAYGPGVGWNAGPASLQSTLAPANEMVFYISLFIYIDVEDHVVPVRG